MNVPSRHVAGVEDGSFKAFSRDTLQHTPLCCVIMFGDRIVDVKIEPIVIDGLNATNALLNMVSGLENEAIILGGITFAGFNIIDAERVNRETGLPVVVYIGEKPNGDSMIQALKKHFSDWELRWSAVSKLGEIRSMVNMKGEPPIYYEVVGASIDWVEVLLKETALTCRIPEPVRVAKLIARGISPFFQSQGSQAGGFEG